MWLKGYSVGLLMELKLIPVKPYCVVCVYKFCSSLHVMYPRDFSRMFAEYRNSGNFNLGRDTQFFI